MRFHTLSIIALFLCLMISSMATLASTDEANGQELFAGSRLVFVEDVTATWCGYCPEASEGLKELSTERSDFRFITLVDDKVHDAADRNEEFDVSGFPTVMFDGGFEEVVGSQSNTDPYDEAIDSCMDRDAPSLAVEVDCIDEGGSELRIDVEITNNDNEDYSGRILLNVVEIESRYLDADGNNYPYSLLAYALDSSISIGSGNTYTNSVTWRGSDIEDMDGNDLSDIDPDNIVIYASVINGAAQYKVRTGMPPSFFTAYYVDAVGEAFPGGT
jgi:thiol-disulfide isomerase/thioredoxin